MHIRIATIDDVDALVDMHCAFRESLQKQRPTRGEFREALRQVLQRNSARVLIAFLDERAAGYATFQTSFSAWSTSSAAVLEDLFVLEGFRECGVGRLLVEAATQEARAMGCSAISLDTNEGNEPSQKIYRRLGFSCERARWNGGRQIRYDLALDDGAEPNLPNPLEPTVPLARP